MRKQELWILDPGILPYEEAHALQEHLVAKRSERRIRDILILLEHTPVVTITRPSTIKNVLVPLERLRKENISFVRTNRGGDVTYHGPGQLVGYPIMDLNNHGKDLHQYVHSLETTVIHLLEDYDIAAHIEKPYPGVWIQDKKIAAIGIAVKRGWISMHGFSLNVDLNLHPFSLIAPCGIRHKGVTSLEKVLNKPVDKQQLRQRFVRHFCDTFCFEAKFVTVKDIR